MNPLGRVGNESISIGTYLCCAFIPLTLKSENPYLYLKALLTSVFFFSLFGFSWIAIPKYLYPWVAILPFDLSFLSSLFILVSWIALIAKLCFFVTLHCTSAFYSNSTSVFYANSSLYAMVLLNPELVIVRNLSCHYSVFFSFTQESVLYVSRQ